MYKKMKKWLSNEKGFTLVEILVVISIIAILFVTLLPQIDFAGDKARQTGVKTDFHTVQIAAESYMREVAGTGLTTKGLNSYLDKGMSVKVNANSTAIATGLDLTKKDPWGKEYDVHIYPTEKVIVFKSFGKDEATGVAASDAAKDDFKLAVYYHQGIVTTCSAGFETNNVQSDLINDTNCGVTTIGATKTAAGTITLATGATALSTVTTP